MPLRVSMVAGWPMDDVLGLSFGDFDFGFETLGIGDAGEVGAGSDVLADFDGDDLKNALDAGANVEGIEFAVLEVVESALLIDFGLLRLNTGAGGVLGVLGAVFFELGADGELLFLYSGELLGDVRADALRRGVLRRLRAEFWPVRNRCGRLAAVDF